MTKRHFAVSLEVALVSCFLTEIDQMDPHQRLSRLVSWRTEALLHVTIVTLLVSTPTHDDDGDDDLDPVSLDCLSSSGKDQNIFLFGLS